MIIKFSTDRQIVAEDKDLLDLEVTSVPESDEPTRTPKTSSALTYDEITGTSVLNNYLVDALNLPIGIPLEVISTNEAVATVEGNKVFQVSGANGTVLFSVEAPGFLGTLLSLGFVGGNTGYDTTGFVDVSPDVDLSKHIYDSVSALISGKDPSDFNILRRFQDESSVRNCSSPSAVPNTSLWCSSVDLSAVSAYNCANGNENFGFAIVSNRHSVGAFHVTGTSPSSTLVWRKPDGSYFTNTAVAAERIESTDLSVVYWENEFPAELVPFKVLPANYRDYIPNVRPGWPEHIIPTIRFARYYPDHSKSYHSNGDVATVCVINTWYASSDDTPTFNLGSAGFVVVNTRKYYTDDVNYEPVYSGEISDDWGTRADGGDSGGPSFLLINDEPILHSVQSTRPNGPSIADYITEVNAAMDSLASAAPGTYTLDTVDLSGFKDWS